jgi:TPR repeat protein
MFRGIVVGLLLALLVALPATAQNYQKGVAAAALGDYATAMQEWRPLAAKGHAGAQYKLGFMYEEGRGVPLNFIKAAKWYRKAAEQGHAVAQRSLGMKYKYGIGVQQDYVFAHMWFSLSAANGDKFATDIRSEIIMRMTPAQIADARNRKQKWIRRHKKK